MNVIKAIFPPGAQALVVHGLHQWDRGQVLEIHNASLPAYAEVHFACVGMTEGAVVHVCDISTGVGRVAIPNECLKQTMPITAWVYAVGATSGETIATITMPIIPRTKPKDAPEIPEDTSDKYTELMETVNRYFDEIDESTDAAVKIAEEKLRSEIADDFEALESDLRTDINKMHSSHVAEVEAKQEAHEAEVEKFITEHALWVPQTVTAGTFDIYAAKDGEESKTYRVWNANSTSGWGFTAEAIILYRDGTASKAKRFELTLPTFYGYDRSVMLRMGCTHASADGGVYFVYELNGEPRNVTTGLSYTTDVTSAYITVSGITNCDLYNKYGTAVSVDDNAGGEGEGSVDETTLAKIEAAYSGPTYFDTEGIEWEQGSLWQGGNSDSTTRVRSNAFSVKKGDAIFMHDAAKGKFKYSVHRMNPASGRFGGETGWMANGEPYVFDADYTVRIVCSFIRDAEIYPYQLEVDEYNPTPFIFKSAGQRNVDIDMLMQRTDRRDLPSMFVTAHRGYSGTTEYPDNSMAAFRRAAELGYKFIETDIYTTSDRHIVLNHDPTVTNTAGDTYTITSTTLAELQAAYTLSNGETLPTIDDFLSFCKTYDVCPMLDLKEGMDSYDEITVLIETIEKYDLADRAFIMDFDPINLAIANGINPNLNLVYLLADGETLSREDGYYLDIVKKWVKQPNNKVYVGYEKSADITATTRDEVLENGLDGIIVHVVDDADKVTAITPYVKGYITNKILPPQVSNVIATHEQTGGYYNIRGEWVEAAEYEAQYTDFIPVAVGDRFSYYGLGCWEAVSVFWYDSNQNIISYGQYNEYGDKWLEYIVITPSNASYARFFSFSWVDDVKKLKVSHYEEKATKSVLVGKKIVYDGDSICYGAGYKGGYAKLIADKVGGFYENQGIGGGRLRTQTGSTDTFHSVVDNLENLPKDGDLYCFEGGINDYWTKGVLGTFDYTNFDGALDETTVCGALETIFRYALNTFVGKPICFIITHKIQGTAYSENSNGDSFKDYHDAMVGICEKYSIPYYDAFSKSGLNGWNTAQNNAYLTGNSAGTPDGCHPNEQGYKRYYVPQLISLFESIMPTDVVEPELPDEPTFTNLLDEAGYTKGIYMTGNGSEGNDANAYTTGYLPVVDKGYIYLMNVTIPDESSHGNRLHLFNENKEFIGELKLQSGNATNPVYDASGNLVQFYFHIDGTRFIRLSAWGIDETSIITYNEPIE